MAILIAMLAAALAGLVTGIGVGVFRVHPLIMTLGMSLVVLGLSNVWQLVMVQTGSGVPAELRTLGSNLLATFIPYSLIVFVPLALLILLALRRSGLRTAAVRRRRQPDRGATLRGAFLAGPHRPVRDVRAPRRRSPGCSSRGSTTSRA